MDPKQMQAMMIGTMALTALPLVVIGITETGLLSVHESNDSYDIDANELVTAGEGAGCTPTVRSERDTTQTDALWAFVYQHYAVGGSFMVEVTDSCGGRAEGTYQVSAQVTCSGLRAGWQCRGALTQLLDELAETKGEELAGKLAERR